ncbi:MFS transporter [Kordiimonas sp.]|uniref:MFS transporter n=1 Tax=Kordiimonas sp. TaxID=1970157 RepID=UPI003A8C927D
MADTDQPADTPAKPLKTWRTPEVCLVLMAAAAPFSFSIWMALLNNFAHDQAHFGGTEIGILQSLREIPGFLAFTAVFVLLILREQVFAVLSLSLLGLGVALTGFFPTEYGLYFTTVIMSVGFHYFETIQMSLSLQWLPKEIAPKALGWQMSAKSVASIAAFGLVWLGLELLGLDFIWLYMFGGGVTVALALYIWATFPRYEGHEVQHKKIILRKRYWLYYALTFMGGARRQIFVVFAGFLLVSKFGYSASEVAALYLANHIITSFVAPMLGGFITRFGERNALIVEYIGLIAVFLGYAYAATPEVAAVLYVLDHLFFSFAIAQKSYLQKIADARDIAATSSVSFSINHIAAVAIPFLFGAFLWPISPVYVFIAGAIMAGVSLILSLNVPRTPLPGNEVVVGHRSVPIAAE